MELSVVVSTLNDREQLLTSLDALSDRTPEDTEVIVVNGPSTDGTTGAVSNRDDVDVLVEISERMPNVSRNAGLSVARGDVVAFLDGRHVIGVEWFDAIERTVPEKAAVVTGPTGNGTDQPPELLARLQRRSIETFPGHNVAFDRTVLEALDGFDEYLTLSDAGDCAHRVAALGFEVGWDNQMAVCEEVGTDGGECEQDWGVIYRELSYVLAKNYGLRLRDVCRILTTAARDGTSGVGQIIAGERTPTGVVADGFAVVRNVSGGLRDGFRARVRDQTTRRNPNGLSTRQDRAVCRYEWR